MDPEEQSVERQEMMEERNDLESQSIIVHLTHRGGQYEICQNKSFDFTELKWAELHSKDVFSATALGNNLKGYVFVSCGAMSQKGSSLQANHFKREAEEEIHSLKAFRIESLGQSFQYFDGSYHGKSLRLVNKTILKPGYPISRMQCAKGQLSSANKVNHGSDEYQPSDVLIACSDSVKFYTYRMQEYDQLWHIGPEDFISLSLMTNEQKDHFSTLPPIPTSFAYDSVVSDAYANFYVGYMDGSVCKWDLNRTEMPVLKVCLSSMEIYDVSMCQKSYAAACADGRFIIGFQNCKVAEISSFKFGEKTWDNRSLRQIKWLNEHVVAVSQSDLRPQEGIQPESCPVFIFDVRYIKRGLALNVLGDTAGPVTAIESEISRNKLHIATSRGQYIERSTCEWNESYPYDQAEFKAHRSGYNKRSLNFVKIPPPRCYSSPYKWEHMNISADWKLFSTQSSLFVLPN